MVQLNGAGQKYHRGLYLKSFNNKNLLRFRFLIQPQYQYLSNDSGEDTSGFIMQRAQVRMLGHLINPRIKYKVMIQGNTTAADGSTLDLRDAYIDLQWLEEFQLQMGQFFVYHDFENLAPAWALHTVDRSIINVNLGFERDVGVQFHGKLFSKRLRYYLYAMNGDGRNKLNANNDMFYGIRLDYSLLGTHQYQVADVKRSNSPHLALGVAYLHDTGAAAINNEEISRLTSDLVFRYKGFSALGLISLARNNDLDTTDWGFLGELGYFLIPSHFEIVGRWASIYRDGALGAGTIDPYEVGAGLNYYLYGHNAKIQVDYTHLKNNGSIQGEDNDRVRVQMQLFF